MPLASLAAVTAVALLSLPVRPSGAQPPHAGHLSPSARGPAHGADVDSLVGLALAVSPAMHAAAARVDAATARVSPAGARPDPMLMAGVQNLPATRPGFADEMTMAMVGVSQTLPLGGKLASRRRAATFEVDAARAELDRVRHTVARDVRVAYYDLAYLDRALALVARNRDALLDLARLAEVRYASGADVPAPRSAMTTPATSGGRLQEVLRARADATRLADDASAMLEERRAVLARLNALLEVPSETPLDSAVVPARIARAAVSDSDGGVRFVSATLGARAAGSPLPSLEDLEARAAAHSPLIRAHEAMIAAQAARADLARRERRPDVDVAVQYGVRPTRPDMVTATVSMPIPIQRRRVQDQLVAAAGADLAALEAEHHQQLAAHRAEIARLRAEAERARTQLALSKAAALPQAHAVLSAGLAAYQAGQVGLAAVLDARAQLFNQETAYFRALTDFAKAVAELELSVGAEVLP
jgi:outer membrane protein TolC